MTHENFEKVLHELETQGTETLIAKNKKYSAPDDALHNFKEGGDIGGCTSAQACWGYMTKHLVALRDKVQRNDFSDREDFLEKIQDSINYLKFIWAIGNEENEKYKEAKVVENQELSDEDGDCFYCIHKEKQEDEEPCCCCKNTFPNTSEEHRTAPNLFKAKNKLN